MINEFGGYYYLECDICGEDSKEDFDDFWEAVEWKKDKSNGWISRKVDGDWEDVCPECRIK